MKHKRSEHREQSCISRDDQNMNSDSAEFKRSSHSCRFNAVIEGKRPAYAEHNSARAFRVEPHAAKQRGKRNYDRAKPGSCLFIEREPNSSPAAIKNTAPGISTTTAINAPPALIVFVPITAPAVMEAAKVITD